jgi:hypothetical protein
MFGPGEPRAVWLPAHTPSQGLVQARATVSHCGVPTYPDAQLQVGGAPAPLTWLTPHGATGRGSARQGPVSLDSIGLPLPQIQEHGRS